MTATIPFVKPVKQISLAPGSTVTIPQVSWQEFELILQQLGENRSARLIYSKGNLEIMVPLPEHEKPKELISDIVKILLKITGRKYEPFGSTTFKKEGIAGVEPDACFYIQNYQCMIGRRRLQVDDPPPDLAIEVDVTSKTAIEAYEAIGVPELWVYDNGRLTIYLLYNSKYSQSEVSPIFPQIPLTQLIPDAVEKSWQVGTVQALEELEALIKN
ncbi:MAG: Uma2 family endonuclease [Xenococcus sp. MO_188.B8]|nr:Uma2 family endonuclease [Xenococcus sp. MO_188.B8]